MALTDARRDHVERHLYFALSRFSGQVKQVQVRLGAENGPKGGVDKTCRVHVRLFGLPSVIVEQADADLHAAIDRSADRVGQTVARKLGRARTSIREGRAGEPATEETRRATPSAREDFTSA